MLKTILFHILVMFYFTEMEEVSDQQPDGEKLTYMYDRDFLLQFQTNPMCLQKPDGLPDLEVVLVQARAPSKPGFQQNRYCAVVLRGYDG